MSESSAIDVDCSALIPQCGFKCSKCMEEIKRVLCHVDGITMAHMEQRGKEKRLIVEHDSTTVWAGQLTKIIERLPSFHNGCFKARVITM